MRSPFWGGDREKGKYMFHVARILCSDAQERGMECQTCEQNHLEPLVFYAETLSRPGLVLPA